MAVPTPEPVAESVSAGAFQRVRDRLGEEIVAGILAAGTVFTIEELERRTGTSRSIVREASRVLVSMGLLRATQRVGLRVLPQSSWNVFDPRVIRWRLRSPGRQQQLRELFELRAAIEPEAARLAAARRDTEQAATVLHIADRLATSGADARPADALGADSHGADSHGADFLDADLAFHRVVLQASGNATFVHLGAVIDEALRERATVERADRPADEHDLRLHVAVAEAIDRGDGASASARMREIIERTQ